MEESNHKPNKIWVDKGSDCYNRSMKSWLEENNIEMCSTHNEEKSVIAERLIRAKKIKIKKNTHIDSSKETDYKNPKFKISGDVKISNYKNVFAKGHTPN